VLKVWHDYRQGHTQDLSGNANHGVPSASGLVYNRQGLSFSGAGVVTVADNAGLQMTTGCWLVYGPHNFYNRVSDRWLICKRDAGGTHLELRLEHSVPVVFTYDGAATRTQAANINGTKGLAINFNSGEIPELFLDGITAGAFSNIATITAYDAPLLIGNYFVPTAPRAINFPIGAVLLTNRALTAAEHLSVYKELAYP